MSTKLKAGTATSGAVIDADTTGILEIQTGSTPTTAVTIDASQNVGINNANPTTDSLGALGGLVIGSGSGNKCITLYSGSGTQSNIAFTRTSASQNGLIQYDHSGDYMRFFTASTERMRIDSSGNLLVNATAQLASEKFTAKCTTNAQSAAFWQAYSSSNNTNVYFFHAYASGANSGTQCNFLNSSGSTVGSITSTGSVTAYVTASDYRLKENVKPMVGALSTVAKLKPVTYDWINGGYSSQGFIAHELQEIVPDCVVGKKDAVNEDGSIIPQAIDTSFLVATLTAALQELNAKVTALETQLGAK
ncbi:Intramolecular chaperone auto-processing domain containing protein [uncultured Caudovirales phage]|uniref:Intramolecular chaperone auto-processing domain containing protein n=1 Tax=uncultured Caudovirales phage TaxID=2100421 RepID=A0A6J7VKY6_9CAUD|nr:Intramolecular chaperone auto-processing domain containing protein [uncultured Caudovirales phage]